jgi:hypothetical protein
MSDAGAPDATPGFTIEALREFLHSTALVGPELARAVAPFALRLDGTEEDEVVDRIVKATKVKAGFVMTKAAVRALFNKARTEWNQRTRGEHETQSPYAMEDQGLMLEVVRGRVENKFVERVRIAARFEVLGQCRNRLRKGWGTAERWRDDDDVVHTAIVLNADLHRTPPRRPAPASPIKVFGSTGSSSASLPTICWRSERMSA